MSHWVCGASATSVGVLASSTTSGASGVRTGSAVADASVIRQGGIQTTGGAAGPGLNVASATGGPAAVSSTGGAAVHTAGAIVGVAGGLVGAFAVFL